MNEDKGHRHIPRSRVANKKFRDNWENIFRKKSEELERNPKKQDEKA